MRGFQGEPVVASRVCVKSPIFLIMKLHLPLSLRFALLACLALFPAAYASTYVATGVNPDKITDSDRFYDNGLGVYWTAAGEQPFTGVQTLYGQTGSTEFLGSLNNYIPAGEFCSASFSGLSNDSKTSWLSTTANVIQYWQSYYGVFSQKASSMPYGYTYNPTYQPTLGGTQSTNLGMYFYDNWTNSGGDFAMAARWYLTNDHTFTNRGEDGVSELKDKNAAAGYFTPFFASHDASVVVTDPSDQEALDAAVVAAFGLTATEKENEYRQAKPGQIAFLGISSGANSDALTCYGFETDANGNVKSLLLASATDAKYATTKLYVKEGENGARMRLYTDAACTQLWQHGGASDWYIDALSYIETPEVLVNMYNEYSSSTLTWTGATSTWTQEADDKALYILPDATSGWTAHAGTGTKFAGDYAAYYTEGRDVLFTSTGAGTIELVGNIEPSRVTVNNAAGADYTFTGEGKLTGITALTKQGEGSLTISTANDYSGGTRLEGGTLTVDNANAFGLAGVDLVGGTLNLNGNTIQNLISVTKDAHVTVKDGLSLGGFVLSEAESYTADNFGVWASTITMKGNGSTSTASFVNLNLVDAAVDAHRGAYLDASSLTISDMETLKFENSYIRHRIAYDNRSLVRGTTLSFLNNQNIQLSGNEIDIYTARGALLYALSKSEFTDNQSIAISGNDFSLDNGGYGAVLYSSSSSFEDNSQIKISNNSVLSHNYTTGGLIYSELAFNAWRNGCICINNNVLECLGEADRASVSGSVLCTSNANVVASPLYVKENSTLSTGRIYGGAFKVSGSLNLRLNDNVQFCDNKSESLSAAVYGGAVYVGYNMNIEGNKAVLITGNKAIASTQAYGGAIFGEQNVTLSNNDEVVIRGNYEKQGDCYRMRSIYTQGSLSMSTQENQSISIYDSVYAGGPLNISGSGQVKLSGEYIAFDLNHAKSGAASMEELITSRTSIVEGTTVQWGSGIFSIQQGAILQTDGYKVGGSGILNLQSGILKSLGTVVDMATATELRVQGSGNLIAADELLFQRDSTLSFSLDARNSEQSALAYFGDFCIEGKLNINIDYTAAPDAGYYVLLDTGLDGGAPENWSAENVIVAGADFSQLVWQDGYLYLKCGDKDIPSHQSYVWQGADGDVWDKETTNWLHGDSVLAYKDHVTVEFNGESSGVVEIGDVMTARAVCVNSDTDLEFVGDGRISNRTQIRKQGEGTLSICTANDFVGGVYIEGGAVKVGHAYALGAGEVILSDGSLDLNEYQVDNVITVRDGRNVTIKNGSSSGDFRLFRAQSFTAENFCINARTINISADLETNITFTSAGEDSTVPGSLASGYLRATQLTLSSVGSTVIKNASIACANRVDSLYVGVVDATYMDFFDDGMIVIKDNTASYSSMRYGVNGGIVSAHEHVNMQGVGAMQVDGNHVTLIDTYSTGSVILAGNMYAENNGDILFRDNRVDVESATVYGGVIGAGNLYARFSDSFELTQNHIAGKNGSVVWGGMMYASLMEIDNNVSFNLSDNSVTLEEGELHGGALWANNLQMEYNALQNISDNNAYTRSSGYGGAIWATQAFISGAGDLFIKSNSLQAVQDAWGGAIYTDWSVSVSHQDIHLCHNTAYSEEGASYGGAICQTEGGWIYLDNPCVSFSYNGDVYITGNCAISQTSAFGGAIYSESDVQFANNSSVLLRGNYEQEGDEYRLRSIYTCGNLELTAGEGQSIQIYDSVYAGGNLVVNRYGECGDVLFSGEHTVSDLQKCKKADGTDIEISNSQTSIVIGTTLLEGGSLSLEYGATLQTGGLSAADGSGAVLHLNHAVLNSSGKMIGFGDSTSLYVEGTDSLIKADALMMGSGSSITFAVDERNKDRAALSLQAPWMIGSCFTINIEAPEDVWNDYYILMDVGMYGSLPENWVPGYVMVNGADFSQLVWQDGYLYLNYGGGDIPAVQTYEWRGEHGTVWSQDAEHWMYEGEYVSCKDNVIAWFSDGHPSEVQLEGKVAARSVLVDSIQDYSFTGEGSLTGFTGLLKRGDGVLSLATTNDYLGGTYLEGGTISIFNDNALGLGEIVIRKGALELNECVIDNEIYTGYEGEITIRNGSSLANLNLQNVRSFEADNFRVRSTSVSITGSPYDSTASFYNLRQTDDETCVRTGGYLRGDTVSISSLQGVYVYDSFVNVEYTSPSGHDALISGEHISLVDNGEICVFNNQIQLHPDTSSSGGIVHASSTMEMNRNARVAFEGNDLAVEDRSMWGFYGGMLYANDIMMEDNKEVAFVDNVFSIRGSMWGGALCANNLVLKQNDVFRIQENVVSSLYEGDNWNYDDFSGLIRSSQTEIYRNGIVSISDNMIMSERHVYGGGAVVGAAQVNWNDSIILDNNALLAEQGSICGGVIDASTFNASKNGTISIQGNSAVADIGVSGVGIYASLIWINDNEQVYISNNRAESKAYGAYGGGMYQYVWNNIDKLQLNGNMEVQMVSNRLISATESLGAGIYCKMGVQMMNNDHVLLRGNVEKQGNDYRLRSIYACGNLELSAGAGQNIQVYDSVYTGGNLVLNENGAEGEILLSGAYTEADLLAVKGCSGTTQEITNSRTNTVVGTTTLGGGVLRMEAGAMLQTSGFSAAAGCDAQVWLDNAALNSSGYDVCFGSGAGLVAGGSNTLTASNFTMQAGSYLSFDLRDKNVKLAALSVNASMSLNGLDVVVMNTDIMAAGKYKLLTLAEGAQYDTGSWTQRVNSVTGVDAASLSWENGTLYYTSTNEWIISVTEDASIIEDTEGKDIVIGNSAMVEIESSIEVPTCRQGHPYCDNPKHGGRPGNPGQGHAKPKPGNSGNNNGDGASASLVIVEGSAYIKDRGAFEGLLDFRGSAEEERHFYTEKDLGVAYITVFTDEDATSHLHIGGGKKVDTVGIVGDGKLEVHGAGRMVLNGHDADESSTLYYGTLGVNEGAVRVENDSQAYVAHTEVRGGETNAGMEVGKGATMTGESITVTGDGAILHNDGSIAMSEGIRVEGGTVKGSGTFSGLTMNGGTLVIGNSPGLQSYTEDLVLDAGKAVFSVGGFEHVATESTSGWSEAVYSSVAMNGHAFTVGDGVTITLAFGGNALEELALSSSEKPLTFSLTLVQNIGNPGYFTTDILNSLVGMTEFRITDEVEGLPAWAREMTGESLAAYVSGVGYMLEAGNLVLSGNFAVNGKLIPEPTTATLSLLALSLLATRRRRRYGDAESQRKSA